jgi:AcrR family transcriptional regulator
VGRRFDGGRAAAQPCGMQSAPQESRRPTGRPRGGFSADIDWERAQGLFAGGELSLSEIAARVGTSKQNLHKHAKRFGWIERREAARRRDSSAPAKLMALESRERSAPAGETPPSRSIEAILGAYIDLFADAVEKGNIRHDTLADLERAVRLLQFVRGQAESIKSTHTTISLERMQIRHRELRDLMAATLDDEVAGVIGIAESIDTTDR